VAASHEQQTADDRRLTTYRVATISPDSGGYWTLHRAEFTERAYAEQWAHQRLFGDSSMMRGARAPERPTNARIVTVGDGVVQVPTWMKVREEEQTGG
jgi:hypothetical protein